MHACGRNGNPERAELWYACLESNLTPFVTLVQHVDLQNKLGCNFHNFHRVNRMINHYESQPIG